MQHNAKQVLKPLVLVCRTVRDCTTPATLNTNSHSNTRTQLENRHVLRYKRTSMALWSFSAKKAGVFQEHLTGKKDKWKWTGAPCDVTHWQLRFQICPQLNFDITQDWNGRFYRGWNPEVVHLQLRHDNQFNWFKYRFWQMTRNQRKRWSTYDWLPADLHINDNRQKLRPINLQVSMYSYYPDN